MGYLKQLLPIKGRKRTLSSILLRVPFGSCREETLDKLESFLESGGANLTLDEYKHIRGNYLGTDKEGRNSNIYNQFVQDAIDEGYDAKKAKRISMLFTDYLTDQHYRLLLTPKESRNDKNEHHRSTMFMGILANGYPIIEDIQKPESLENRAEKEKTFYYFERAVFIPDDKRYVEERINEVESTAFKIDDTRMSKYKIHTLEMAINYVSKSKKADSEKKDSIVSKVIGKVASYFSWKN